MGRKPASLEELILDHFSDLVVSTIGGVISYVVVEISKYLNPKLQIGRFLAMLPEITSYIFGYRWRIVGAVFSLLGFILLAPMIAVITIGLKIENAGPILENRRIRFSDGREYPCLKFTTSEGKEGDYGGFFTQFVKITHMDEIPLLWNLLIGNLDASIYFGDTIFYWRMWVAQSLRN